MAAPFPIAGRPGLPRTISLPSQFSMPAFNQAFTPPWMQYFPQSAPTQQPGGQWLGSGLGAELQGLSPSQIPSFLQDLIAQRAAQQQQPMQQPALLPLQFLQQLRPQFGLGQFQPTLGAFAPQQFRSGY